MTTKSIIYSDGELTFNGYCSYPDSLHEKTPVIMVCHDWTGRNAFACQKADDLAKMGYIGFAIDMFGNGKLGQTKEEKSALIQPLLQNRNLLLQRMLAALETIKKIENSDPAKIAAIGFCFGGLCALDLARSGANIAGVVSFHGLLNAPDERSNETIKAKVLALHGYDDPMATPDQVMIFANEMTRAKADWQLYMYGNTMHAFTNPEANDPIFGTVYNTLAAKRSWISMQDFLEEILMS